MKCSRNAFIIFFDFVTLTTPRNFSDSMLLSPSVLFLAYAKLRYSNFSLEDGYLSAISTDKTLLRTKLCRVATVSDRILCWNKGAEFSFSWIAFELQKSYKSKLNEQNLHELTINCKAFYTHPIRSSLLTRHCNTALFLKFVYNSIKSDFLSSQEPLAAS